MQPTDETLIRFDSKGPEHFGGQRVVINQTLVRIVVNGSGELTGTQRADLGRWHCWLAAIALARPARDPHLGL